MMLKNGQNLEMLFLSVPLICDPIPNQPTIFVCNSYDQFAFQIVVMEMRTLKLMF